MLPILLVILSIICTVYGARHKGNRVTIEFEDSADLSRHQDRIMWRGGGSMKRTLLLYEEEYIDIKFCLSALTKITVTNIRYSNDGLADHVLLFMNNQTVAEFETIFRTNWGHMWNVFSETGPLTYPILLSPGYHTLRILINLSDNYGTELDSLEFQLENQPSNEVFFCTKALTEYVMFSQLPPPNVHRDKTEIVNLLTNIQPFQCIDKYNVFMCLQTNYLIGMQISAHSEYLNNSGLGLKWEDEFEATPKCYVKNITLWTLGKNDNSNKDLGLGATGFLSFDAEKLQINPKLMPGTIYNPTSSVIYIKFSTPIQFERGAVSGTFSLGLVNPKMSLVRFQYFNHKKWKWSTVERRIFNPTSRTHFWIVKRGAFSHKAPNTIRISFSGSTLPVKIDFIQFDLQSDDPIVSTLDLFHDSQLEVYGLQHSSHSNTKMVLSSAHAPGNRRFVDQVSIMARKGRRAPYYKVITLHSDGRLMLYTLAELRPLMESYPEAISEPSGIFIGPNLGFRNKFSSVAIATTEINAESNSIRLRYTDGSNVLFRFSIVADTTRLVLYETNFINKYPYYSCYFSKYINDNLKAVSNILVDDRIINVDKSFPVSTKGKRFYFDHEEASWYIQAGSDLIVVFP